MMSRLIDERLLGDRIVPPEDEYNSFSSIREFCDRSIGEALPSHLLVTRRLSLTDREDSVQEEDSLLRPVSEISLCSLDSDIRLQFFEYIAQARLCLGSVRY
jgi:hypothetical protein